MGGQLRQCEDGRVKAGCQTGCEDQHLPWGERQSRLCANTLCPHGSHTKEPGLSLVFGSACCALFPVPFSFFHFSHFPYFLSFPGALVFCCLTAFTPRDPGTCLQHRIDRVLWDPCNMGMVGCSSGPVFQQQNPGSEC